MLSFSLLHDRLKNTLRHIAFMAGDTKVVIQASQTRSQCRTVREELRHRLLDNAKAAG
jgi:hypothetical protein